MTSKSEANRLSEPGIEVLPEDCIIHAISLTSPSPRDASCFSAVSTAFRSAAASDSIWNSFLPSDLESILARADRSVDFSSKRELFFRLCDQPILLDGGKMIFSLDRSSGAKCFMLSARELAITWADTDPYWRWVPAPDSRFSEVAELLKVSWLEIRGHFQSNMLSSKTTYAAYLIFKLSDDAHDLGHPLQEAFVNLGTKSSTSLVCLQPSELRYAHMHAQSRNWGCFRCPQLRGDGWMEIELGEFYNSGEEDEEVAVRLLEAKCQRWKKGLIVEGIEIKPK